MGKKQSDSVGIIKTIFPVVSGNTGETKEINFSDGSFFYFNKKVAQSYEHVLIDNIGTGDVRISFQQGINLTNPATGAKTLKAGDNLFINDTVYTIAIYFIGTSVVEMIMISD